MLNGLIEIYKGKRIFLTGHTGFKGSWMLKILSKLGAEIRGYALDPEENDCLYNLINGNSICTSVIADLRDKTRLESEMKSFKPDFVFHFAAQPLVRLSYKMPIETFEINAIGTANVLDGIRLLNNKCCAIMITTDKVYHNNEWVYPYRETDRLGGHDPYSASKACAELIINSYKSSFFNSINYSEHQKSIAVGRAGNVIGGGDWSKDRLLPDIARALGNRNKIVIRNPVSIRPWQHVLEPLAGYLLLGAKLWSDPQVFASAYNFGPNIDDSLTVEQMVKLSIMEWGEGEYESKEDSGNPHEAGLLKLDISKAVNELKYMPVTNAADAIKMTIEWYKNYFNKDIDNNNFTDMQIQNFFDIN